VTVGDFVPRSMSEIIEDEMPLRASQYPQAEAGRLALLLDGATRAQADFVL
jgi:hypothetical protein